MPGNRGRRFLPRGPGVAEIFSRRHANRSGDSRPRNSPIAPPRVLVDGGRRRYTGGHERDRMSGMRRLGGARHAGEGHPLSALHAPGRDALHARSRRLLVEFHRRMGSGRCRRAAGACRGAGQRAVGRTAGPLSPRHSRAVRPGGLLDRPDRRGAGRSTASAVGLPHPARLAGVAAIASSTGSRPGPRRPLWRRRGSSSPWARRRSLPPWTALPRPAMAASCRRSPNRSSMPWRTSARRRPTPWARRWARPSRASAPRPPTCWPRWAPRATARRRRWWPRWPTRTTGCGGIPIEALGNMGAEAASAVDALLPLLEHPDALTRRRAIEALGRIGPPAKSAAAALQNACQHDPDEAARKAAAVALYSARSGEIGRQRRSCGP